MSADPNRTYSLESFINLKDSEPISYKKYSILEQSITEPNVMYSIDNIIYPYMDEINQMRKIVTLTDKEILRYKFKPKLFAYDVYGSTEIYFVILAMNGMYGIKEFTLEDKQLYALRPSDMNSLMNTIYNAETEYLSLNRSTLGITES